MRMNISTSAVKSDFRVKTGTRTFQNTSRIISTILGNIASVTTVHDVGQSFDNKLFFLAVMD
jgi:hypothetical protein